MKNIFIAFILLLNGIYLNSAAQKGNLKFHSIISTGSATGQSGTSGILQTVNGFSMHNWFAGIGFGADYNHYKTYPLFFDLRKMSGKKKNIIIYGDLGVDLPGKNGPSKAMYYLSNQFYNGLYSDLGIGYKFRLNSKSGFLLTAGYSNKRITKRTSVVMECFTVPCPVNYEDYKYGDGRVILKAGIDF